MSRYNILVISQFLLPRSELRNARWAQRDFCVSQMSHEEFAKSPTNQLI